MANESMTTAPSATDPMVETMQRNLARLMRNLERCDQGLVSQCGVTTSQGSAILAFPESGSVTMNELSRGLGLANSTMTRMVEYLVARGLVQRAEDKQDRRVVRVALTGKGRKVRSSVTEANRRLQQLILSELQGSERSAVLEALVTLNQAIEKAMRTCCGE